jgi:hypothetical protein
VTVTDGVEVTVSDKSTENCVGVDVTGVESPHLFHYQIESARLSIAFVKEKF